MTIYTFSGTPGATYVPAVDQINYGDIFKYGADGASLRGDGGGSYAQLEITTVVAGVWRNVVTFDRIAAGSGDSVAANYLNASRSGFAIEVGSAGGGTMYFKLQTGGGNSGDIIAAVAGIGEPLGLNTIEVEWDLATGAFSALYNGVLIASSTYNTIVTLMNAGVALYKDAASNNITIKQLDVGAAASTSIDTVTTDGNPGFVVGRPFTYTETGLGTVTGFTVTTAATPAATTDAINLAAGAGELKSWVDGEYYPFIGTVAAEADDGTLTGAGNFPLALPAATLSVTFASVETTDDTYIGTKLDDLGHPLADGDKGYYPVGNGLAISPNSGVSCLGAMTFVLWVHKLSGIMERYDVVINDAGEITDVTGITSRGITSRGITSRNISKRGLS